MEKKSFRIRIDAPKEKVWQTLWNKQSYEQWTTVFAEGSTIKTDDYKPGTRVEFTDGKGSGMFSEVASNIPDQEMIFRHLGEMKDGKDLPPNEKSEAWAGAEEAYYLKEENGGTELTVTLDIDNVMSDYFTGTFPKALDKIKTLAEQ